MARRATPPGSGYWSAVEASAQGLSQTRRQRIAREMREYLARDTAPVLEVDTPARRNRVERDTWWPNTTAAPGHVALNGAASWTIPSNGNYRVSISHTFDSFRQSLDTAAAAFDEIGRKAGKAAQVKSDSCDCDEPNNPFWTHSQEGCEFVPRRVELQHVH